MTSQERAIEQLERISHNLSAIGEKEDYTDIAIQALDKEPCEDSKPIVHAHWVYGYTFPDGQYRKCSACKELIKVVANDGNFCGHCGAKMDDQKLKYADQDTMMPAT